MSHVSIIVNPLAGGGRALTVAKQARQRLVTEGEDVEVLPTRERGGATDIAREAAAGADWIVVAGGDGTLRETIAGLGEAAGSMRLGLLPFGNSNVVARELGIPLDPKRAVETLTYGAPQAIDVGRVNGELFLAMVGIGFDALCVRHLDWMRHTAIGRTWYRAWADSVYVTAGGLALCRFAPPRFEVTVDGERCTQPYRAAVVSNLRTYAKCWSMTPDADRLSGRLHLQLRKRSFAPLVLWHVACAIAEKSSPAFISDYGAGRRIELESSVPVPYQVDGDYKGTTTRLELEVRPAAVRIIAPESGTSAQGTGPASPGS